VFNALNPSQIIAGGSAGALNNRRVTLPTGANA
jgi:hypothetical protein